MSLFRPDLKDRGYQAPVIYVLAAMYHSSREANGSAIITLPKSGEVASHLKVQQNPDKAQALRQAMLTTMKQHPFPKDWAAFTLIGEAQ